MFQPRLSSFLAVAMLLPCLLAGARPLALSRVEVPLGLSGIEGLLAQRTTAQLPHVHFVATGGTISNRDGGRLTAEELAKNMPGVERVARVTYEQFANVASSELTLDQWLGLSKRINEVFAGDKELAGVVV